ncbi:MAG: SocA family protein [Azoarcus sp.]|nr:SocA family protein [Azoarcus sp.]
MLITHERKKLINAIIFFAKNVKHLGKIKLFKLLYFLDFEHFKETGRSVTALDYYAWKMGPAPATLSYEIDTEPEPDLKKKVRFDEEMTDHGTNMLIIKPRSAFDDSHFTKREMRIMTNLAKKYRQTLAKEIIEDTHSETLPWHKVYNEEGKNGGKIPYEYSVSQDEKENMAQVIRERNEFLEFFQSVKPEHA